MPNAATSSPLQLESTFGLHGQVAVVTGASSGFGMHFARTLHGAGAAVVGVARRAARLEALCADLGDRTLAVSGDVASAEARAAVVDETMERFGRIDLLVNNAGISHPGRPAATDESMAEHERVLEVNVAAAFGLCQSVGAVMLEQRSGAIVNVGSILGQVAAPSDVSYSASKGAVASLTRALAVQWAHAGVRVNCLAPGFFPTEMNTGMFDDDAAMSWLRRRCPAGRAGRLQELDAALLFLCSPASTYFTGQTVTVDGGWTAC